VTKPDSVTEKRYDNEKQLREGGISFMRKTKRRVKPHNTFKRFQLLVRGTRSLKAFVSILEDYQNTSSPKGYIKSINFLRLYPKLLTGRVLNSPKGNYKSLVNSIYPIINDWKKSIYWNLSVIEITRSQISEFIQEYILLNKYFMQSEYHLALETIASIEVKFGVSIILLLKKITIWSKIYSHSDFIKAVDKFIESNGNNTAASYIARQYSLLYDPNLAQRDYQNIILNRSIQRVPQEELRCYILYILSGTLNSENDIPKILSCAAAGSIFDVFFSLYEIVNTMQINITLSASAVHFYKLVDQFNESHFNLIKNKISNTKNIYSTIDSLMYFGYSTELGISPLQQNDSSLRGSLKEHFNYSHKNTHIYRFTLLYFPLYLNLLRYSNENREFSKDFNLLEKANQTFLEFFHVDYAKMSYFGALKNDFYDNSIPSNYAKAVNLSRSGNFESAVSLLKNTEFDFNLNILLCCILGNANDKASFAVECANNLTFDLDYAFVLPLGHIFNKQWRELKTIPHKLELALCLFGLQTAQASRGNLRNLRYASQDFLQEMGVIFPSELKFTSDNQYNRLLIFFLRNVCNTEVLLTSRGFNKIKDVEIERRKILANLLSFDEENADDYRQEILMITTKHKIEDEIKRIDRSRIFVDLNMLISWANTALLDSYNRYKLTFAKEVKNLHDIVIKQTHLDSENPIVIYTDTRESVAIISDIIVQVKDNYLNNAEYGLDSYLSMRIRHGSFSGHLRSPLQNSQMIASIDDENNYSFSSSWLDLISNYDRVVRVKQELISFSIEFDKKIDYFINSLLRIKSDQKPNGFFHIDFSREELNKIRDIALDYEGINSLIIDLAIRFKGKINENLKFARNYIETKLRPEIMFAMNRMRENISYILTDYESAGFISLYSTAQHEVQNVFSRIVEWFDFNSEYERNSDFTFNEYVELCIESARYSHVDFNPVFNISISGEPFSSEEIIYRINDIIFTLTHNVYKHSGLKNTEVKIDLNFTFIDKSKINLIYKSPISYMVDNSSIRNKSNEIMQKIRSGQTLPQTKTEGNTGLIKVATIARLTGGDIVNFGVDETNSSYIVNLSIGKNK
jgi:hypothetical protein